MLTRFNLLKTCCFILSLLAGFCAPAQSNFPYTSYTTSQGLSQGMVYCLLQDSDSFIWAGTKEGLNRFDGYNFKIFTNDPYDPHSLGGNNVFALSQDSKGRIWACTENAGISVYDTKSGQFRRIMHEAANHNGLISNKMLKPVYELADGKYLAVPEGGNGFGNIITLPAGYFTGDKPATVTTLALPAKSPVALVTRSNRGIVYICFQDKSWYALRSATGPFEPMPAGLPVTAGGPNADGTLWSGGTVFLIDDKKVYPVYKSYPPLAEMPGYAVQDKLGRLWQSYPQGVRCSDIRNWRPGKPLDYRATMHFDLNDLNTSVILIDRGGNLWQGSRGLGLRKYVLPAYQFNHLAAGNSIRNIMCSGRDSLFLSVWGRSRHLTINGTDLPLPAFSMAYNDPDFSNYLIARNGDAWVVAPDRNHLLRWQKAARNFISYPLPAIFAAADEYQPLLEDRRGNIWFSGIGGELLRMNPVSGQPAYYYIKDRAGNPLRSTTTSTALYEDVNGTIWLGNTLGFARLEFGVNPEGQPVITWYDNNVADKNSLSYNHVSCFLDDPADNNYLWVGTKGGGLNRLNKKTGSFLHLTVADGLPNAVVNGLLPDSAGNIWGSTNRGLFCMLANKKNGLERKFRIFTKTDGLQGDEFNGGAATLLPGGNLAFGGVNGLTIFNPAGILDKSFETNVFITNILVGNQPVAPGDATGILHQTIENTAAITLTHLQDLVTLEFSSLDFSAPEQNKYRYQMAGLDEGWVESGNRRSATYLHLPAGKYVFKVQGSNSQGVWSDKIVALSITVLPPWWLSWWAYTMYVLLFALAVGGYIRFIINRARLRNQLIFEQLEAKRIKELDTTKTQLYTNITHEFRTPLTVIIGMAQQVKNNPQEHLENGMDMIMRNGQSLLNLVNELLDLSKLETGKMQLRLVKGDVIGFLRYIVESFHSLADNQRKQLHLLAELDELYIEYDAEKLRQIVSNLVSNALKFTPEKGNIYINVFEGPAQAGDCSFTLVIKIKDTGVGIPEAQLQHIFERFYQLDNSHTRQAEGTGIGLALTRELVKLMDGEITVKSPPTGANKGSEFTVTLPFKKLADSSITAPVPATAAPEKLPLTPAAAIPVTGDTSQAQTPLILLVEDNADVVAYTASCLPDYRLAVGKDGAEGFDIAKELVPDLVITDVMMPFVDGFELTRKLRRDEHTSHIPIIMLTAKADRESRIEGFQHGADMYLEKPFNREELLVRIAKLLELRKHLQDHYLRKAGLSVSQPATAATPAASAEPAAAAAIATEDAFVKKVRETVEAHLTDTAFSVEQLCKLLFMSHSQLHRKLDALTGCSPNKFMRMIRLNKARQLLRSSNDSISGIALDCGYNDAGYFARVFKQEHGITPQEFRLGEG